MDGSEVFSFAVLPSMPCTLPRLHLNMKGAVSVAQSKDLEKHGERVKEICFQKRERFCVRELYQSCRERLAHQFNTNVKISTRHLKRKPASR